MIGVALAGLAVSLPATAQRATPVGVDTVRSAQSAQTLPVTARVVAPEAGPIAARTQGTVSSFSVEVGDRVDEGDTIAILDRQIQRTQLAQAKAELERAKATESLARNQLDRISRLRDSSAFEEQLYDTRAAELSVAVANRQLATVNLRAAETDFSWGTVKAPFPGVITLRHTNTGAWVSRGTPVVDMVNVGALEIAGDVPAAQLSGLSAGTAVTIQLPGKTTTGTVRAVVPSQNAATRTQELRVTPDDLSALDGVAANSAATVLVPVGGTQDVLTVHKDAVLRRGSQASVYVVRDGKAVPQDVELGAAVGSRLAVLSGLSDGDEVVIRGNERLRPGQDVMTTNGDKPEQADKADAASES